MDTEKLGQVLAAFELLAEKAGGTLDKAPNVADVKEAGVDVTADERDEAWKAYEAAQETLEDEGGDGVPVVTNAYTNPMSFNGVTIPVGESRPVPGFDRKRPFNARCIKAGVIKVG